MKIDCCLSVFFGMVGWFVASGSAYGDYPPAGDIYAHLVGKEGDASIRFKRLFCEVREEATKNRISDQPDPRKLVGDERGILALPKTAVSDVATSNMPSLNIASLNRTLSDISLSEESVFSPEESDGEKGAENGNSLYLADDERCWLRQYFVDGDFSVKIDGLTVQKSEDIDELVKSQRYRRDFAIAKKNGYWKDAYYPILADVFKMLASEIFMKKLLGGDTVRAFYGQAKCSRTTVYIFCYPSFDKDRSSTVSFCLMYRQNGCNAYCPMMIVFNIQYDIGNDRFADTPVNLSTFRIGAYRIVAKKQVGN